MEKELINNMELLKSIKVIKDYEKVVCNKFLGIIEHLITNALDTGYESAQEGHFSGMNEEDNKEYGDNFKKIISLEHSINEMLPPEGKKILFDLDCLIGTNSAIEARYMFKKGAIEGLTNLQYLKETSECVYLPSIKI